MKLFNFSYSDSFSLPYTNKFFSFSLFGRGARESILHTPCRFYGLRPKEMKSKIIKLYRIIFGYNYKYILREAAKSPTNFFFPKGISPLRSTPTSSMAIGNFFKSTILPDNQLGQMLNKRKKYIPSLDISIICFSWKLYFSTVILSMIFFPFFSCNISYLHIVVSIIILNIFCWKKGFLFV